MNIEKLTKLDPITLGFQINPDLPVIPLAMEVEKAGCAAPHAHPRGQIIYAERGVMRVICKSGIWIVPPSQAVWAPPDMEHEVYFPGQVSLRNLFVDPSTLSGMPKTCTVFKVSPLMRELISRAMQIGTAYLRGSPGWRLMQVLLDELRQAEPSPLHLPLARDPRIMRVIEALLKNPGDTRDLNAWGHVAGASPRTLARLFTSETGLTFGTWKKKLHLQQTIDRLSTGESVTCIAFDLGYQSLSAFIEMFRKSLGVSPGQYLRKLPASDKFRLTSYRGKT